MRVLRSVLLPNGNLVVPSIVRKKPKKLTAWIEVEPGTSKFKFWWPVHEEAVDPRTEPKYVEWVKKNLPDAVETYTR